MTDANIINFTNPRDGITLIGLHLQSDNEFFDSGAVIINCLDLPVKLDGRLLASSIGINGLDRPIVKYENAYSEDAAVSTFGINNIVPKIYNLDKILDAVNYMSTTTDAEILLLSSMKIVEVAEVWNSNESYYNVTFCGVDKYSSEKMGSYIKINRINLFDFDLNNNIFGDVTDSEYESDSTV